MDALPATHEAVTDSDYMLEALSAAREAAQLREVPVGAVAVYQDRVIARAFNTRERDRTALAHAELEALGQASRTLGAWRLTGVTLYVTLEPCAMCAGALIQARIDRLVFGATDPKAGAVVSLYRLLDDARLNHQVEVAGGVEAQACSDLLVQFFKSLRA